MARLRLPSFECCPDRSGASLLRSPVPLRSRSRKRSLPRNANDRRPCGHHTWGTSVRATAAVRRLLHLLVRVSGSCSFQIWFGRDPGNKLLEKIGLKPDASTARVRQIENRTVLNPVAHARRSEFPRLLFGVPFGIRFCLVMEEGGRLRDWAPNGYHPERNDFGRCHWVHPFDARSPRLARLSRLSVQAARQEFQNAPRRYRDPPHASRSSSVN